MPLKSKLILLLFAFTLIPLVLFGTIVFSQARNILQTVRMAQLDSIADLKKDKIETFFHEREGDIRSAQDFRNIRTNLPVLSAHAGDRTAPAYVQAKKSLDDQIKTFQESYGYLDVMLLDPLGKVVYTSNDEHSAVQLGKPLHNRKFFEEGKKGIYFTDVFFGTEADRRVEMIGIAPVRDLQGAFVGAVAIEIDMAPIFKFIQDTTGLGTTGEALIARKEGNETLFLSPLRHEPNAALKKVVSSQEKIAVPAIKAAGGENGSGITHDYHGEEVLAAWRYIPFLRWGLVTKIDASEVFAPVRKLRALVIFIGIFIVAIGALAALAIARTITRPIQLLQEGAEAIRAGNLQRRVGIGAQDEVGRLSRAFDAMTYALVSDISERKRAEKLLSENEIRLKRSEEIAHLGGWELDLVNNTLTWSDEVYRIFGLQPQEFGATYEAFLEAVHPEDRAAVDDAYSGSLREGRDIYEIEHRVVRKATGEIRSVHEKCQHFRDETGKIIRSVGMVHDITERKAAEVEIKTLNNELKRHVLDLETANRELEAFAYSVSHDLRSPLRSIEGFSLALLEDYAGKLDDTGKSYLTRVRNATMRMGHLIDDLLKLSRVSRSEMNRERVDLSAMANAIAGDFKKQNPERPAEFIIAGGLTAACDGRLVTVAMENLFANAWKFSEKTARTVIEFGVTARDDTRAFFVKDNGIGFDAFYAGKLFNPFQRLHKAEEFPGTGIGLATVKRIINRHGGRVWIESEVNKGTTVYFTL